MDRLLPKFLNSRTCAPRYTLVTKLLAIALLFFQGTTLQARENGTLYGTVTDSVTSETLIGVNIREPGGQGAATDLAGNYRLSLPAGNYVVTFSYVGYKPATKTVVLPSDDSLRLDVLLSPDFREFDEVVVSGSRYARRVSEEVISIEVVRTELIDNTVAIKLDDLMKRVSGMNVNDGQASIRGGSGWSYSIGSRVNLVIDGQSMLTPDRSSIKWRYLPMENVGQIEVLKGASSVLYGSSAMNGTIHLQTIKPTKTPQTRISTYVEALDGYDKDAYNWWTGTRLTTGGYFSRAHKVSDKFEYVVGLNTNYTQHPYYGKWKFDDYHMRANLMARWTGVRRAAASFGFRLNYAFYNENDFLFWEDTGPKALYAVDVAEWSYHSFNIDPFYTVYDKRGNKHHIQSRLYYFDPEDSRNGGFVNVEYQFQKSWMKGWTLSAGGLQDFLAWNDNELNGFRYGLKWALYAQADKQWDKVSVTAGMRTELFRLSDRFGAAYAFAIQDANTGDVQPVPLPLFRVGVNYQPGKNSFLRFNFGQAFRLPSLYEAFLDYEFNGIDIVADPDLRPEYGWTAELGLKQFFAQTKKYKGGLDLAFYWQEYRDMIEFQVSFIRGVALVSHNLPTARIAGYEVELNQSFETGRHRVALDFGYTYAFPIELSGVEGVEMRPVGAYLKNLFKYAGPIKNTPEDLRTTGALLKYRNRHLVNLVLEYENEFLFLGFYGRYYSLIENGDFEFDSDAFSFIPGLTQYWEDRYPKGDFVADVSVGVKFLDKHRISLLIRNAGNREYMLRLGKIEPPRSFAWQYKVEF